MSPDAQDTSRKTSTCPKCRTLNGSGFSRCARCGYGFSVGAQFIDNLGSRFDGDDLWGSKFLILLTLVVFGAQWIGQIRSGQEAFDALTSPTSNEALRFGALDANIVISEPLRLVSSIFVHFGVLHLIANLFFLTWLGRTAEPAVGSARFVLAYIVTGIAGFVASTAYSMLFESFGGGLTAGASGAVFGITGMVLGMLYRQKNPQWKSFAVQAVLFQLLIGFAINRAHVGIMINNLAHLGGVVVGLIFGFTFATSKNSTRRPTRTEFFMNVGALVGLIVCVASLVLAQNSPLSRESGDRQRSSVN